MYVSMHMHVACMYLIIYKSPQKAIGYRKTRFYEERMTIFKYDIEHFTGRLHWLGAADLNRKLTPFGAIILSFIIGYIYSTPDIVFDKVNSRSLAKTAVFFWIAFLSLPQYKYNPFFPQLKYSPSIPQYKYNRPSHNSDSLLLKRRPTATSLTVRLSDELTNCWSSKRSRPYS